MDLARLAALLPPPAAPAEETGHDWPGFEAASGLPAPAAWQAFLARYGTGAIGGFLWLLNSFSANRSLNAGAIGQLRDSYTVMKAEFPGDYPRDPAALVPFALSDDGDSLACLMHDGDPDAWPVVIHDKSQAEEEATGLAFLPFLEALLEGRLRSDILPEDVLRNPGGFTPLQGAGG